MASLKSRQPPHTARLTTAPSSALSLGRYSSTRSAISTRVFELALPAYVHLMCVRVHRSGWPRRAAALGRSWQCRGAQEPLSRDLYRQRCHHRRPSTCSATRAQRSRTASCRWPLVRARVRVRVRLRFCSGCSMRCHAAGTKGRHTAYFPPSPQVTPHGSRLASAWMRACSPSPQTVSHRRMPLRVEVPRLGRTAEILASLSWEVITGQTCTKSARARISGV